MEQRNDGPSGGISGGVGHYADDNDREQYEQAQRFTGVTQEGDIIRGGINVSVDLPKIGGRRMYRVRVERTTIMETDLLGTPAEVIEAAKQEANGNSIVSDERVSVWIPGDEIEEPEKIKDPWEAYSPDNYERDLAALSDEENHPFPDSH